MEKNYRIKEKIYQSGNKEYTPQYKNGDINGNTYAISKYYGKPIEDLPDELYWFDFTIWMNNVLVASSFKTYDEAFSIIKKDIVEKNKSTEVDGEIIKEIIHVIY